MSFKFVMVPPNLLPHWPDAIRKAVPECDVHSFGSLQDATDAFHDADAIYGTINAEILSQAKKLRWLAAPRAGLGGDWFFKELVESPVTVTNTRGIFNDHLSAHIIGLIIADSRHFDYYMMLQAQRRWGPGKPIRHLPDCTLLIIGCGEAGAATADLAKGLGMTVLATDPRVNDKPDSVDELHPPEALMELLPRADYTVMIVPETPDTMGMMGEKQFQAMKPGSYFINVGRGKTVCLDPLVNALRYGPLGGASLDVFETEPLPPEHPLWVMPTVRITPHISGEGPHCWERRLDLIIENCQLFAAGKELKNIVDKSQWF